MKTSGLMLFPGFREGATVIAQIIESSDFYAEYNHEFGCFFFPENEESYDTLESDLDELLAGSDVSYRIEGVF
jgi:hypothetical protein